jgi:hypothetical protein
MCPTRIRGTVGAQMLEPKVIRQSASDRALSRPRQPAETHRSHSPQALLRVIAEKIW